MKRTSAYLFKSKYGLVWFIIAVDLHQTIISSNNQVKDTISSDVITIKGQYSCKLQNINIFFVFKKNLFSNPVMKFLRSISYLHFVFHLAIPSDVMEPFWIKTQIHVHVTPSINKYHLKKKIITWFWTAIFQSINQPFTAYLPIWTRPTLPSDVPYKISSPSSPRYQGHNQVLKKYWSI